MTANYSMELSETIKDLMASNLSGLLQNYFPTDKLREKSAKLSKRDRIYNDETTILTMLISSIQEDKSLQNAVNIYQGIHNANIEKIKVAMVEHSTRSRAEDSKLPAHPGQPKKYKPRVSKSKLQAVSANTSGYTQARQRVSEELFELVFKDSSDFSTISIPNKWKGYEVNITDGTYIQMQDTEELREIYDIRSDSPEYKPAYPQGLLQVIIEQGSGAIKHFSLGSRHVSELELVSTLLREIKQGTLLLADDLYNSYAIFHMIRVLNLELIVPGKRVRNYEVVKKISEGDEIVRIKKSGHPVWLNKDIELPSTLIMRRLSFEDVHNPGKEFVLYTTLLDESIEKTDIVLKYFTRWDIEISIREIKTLMGINIVRSKKSGMVIKELYAALTAYNLTRKIIATATENSGFSPQEHIIQKHFEAGKTILMDKNGKTYQRWSSGRPIRTYRKDQETEYSISPE